MIDSERLANTGKKILVLDERKMWRNYEEKEIC